MIVVFYKCYATLSLTETNFSLNLVTILLLIYVVVNATLLLIYLMQLTLLRGAEHRKYRRQLNIKSKRFAEFWYISGAKLFVALSLMETKFSLNLVTILLLIYVIVNTTLLLIYLMQLILSKGAEHRKYL